ncbi:MAG: helix-turn-helix domain-containing protein [Pseudodesulfovibrio sp.]|nr:helix-turn-helix domain-containing protein [Pseudodesulfovibrio sp.]
MVASSNEDGATSFEDVLNRLKEATNTFSDSEFARKALNKGQSTISSAKERGKLPPIWVETVAKNYHISSDWLFFGEGLMRRGDSTEVTHPREAPGGCAKCAGLEIEMGKERDMNRDLVAENRQLWKENGELKVKIGELNVQNVKLEGELDTAQTMAKEYYERLQARAAPEEDTPHEATRDCA